MSPTRMAKVGALGVAAALAVAAPASAATIKGTVVHKNQRAHSVVVSGHGGRLTSLHVRRSPRVGSVITASVRRLRNGTFAASRVRVSGRRQRAAIRGTVTHVNRRAGDFTVSARGVSILVRRHRSARHSSVRATRADALPAVGTEVQVDVSLDGRGDVEENHVRDLGQDTNGMDLEGVVLSTDAGAGTITVSADDDNEEGGPGIVVHVPDASGFTVGQEVELTVTGPDAADGSYTLSQSSGDDNEQEADDQGDQSDQGDQHGDGSGDSPQGSGDSGQDD